MNIEKKHEAEQANSTIHISFILSFNSAGLLSMYLCVKLTQQHIG